MGYCDVLMHVYDVYLNMVRYPLSLNIYNFLIKTHLKSSLSSLKYVMSVSVVTVLRKDRSALLDQLVLDLSTQ